MKILITDPISDNGKQLLKESGLDVLDFGNADNSEYSIQIKDADGWIIRSGTKITSEFLEMAVNLKVIGRAGVGVDNIDIPAATFHGVLVMNTPAVNTISAAEHTIALILALARNVHKGYTSLSQGNWDRNKLVGSELKGKKVGIVGLGKIGSEVIKRLHSFGMEILGYDPYIQKDHYEYDFVEFMEFDDLCKNADIISIHIPKTEQTDGIFNTEKLKLMKSTALLINCSRGGIIVEKDLVKALNDGLIAGAAIDVFTQEPPTDTDLISAKNLLYTPHLGASTFEAKEGVSTSICEQMRDFLLNGKIENALNIPISDFALLQMMEPYLNLADKLGKLHYQLSKGPAKTIKIETLGSLKEVNLITLSFLKGFLENIHGSTVNFVNAIKVAETHGIEIQETYKHGEKNYSNLISTSVINGDKSLEIRASLFSDQHPRIVYFDGYHFDLNPKGTLLLIYNNDVPGVVGKVGAFLGEHKINIASYHLSRKNKSDIAFGVVQLDSMLDESAMNQLTNVNEIQSVFQVNL
tara:strand:- start:7962 stop:9533 length:1572 start_codon:yes stop_codon:yes gene_type:complete